MDERPTYEIIPLANLYSPAMLQAIGAFFLASASAEMSLRTLLARIHNCDSETTFNTVALLSGMEVGVMLEKIVVGAMISDPNSRPEIAAICDKIRACFQRRNEIAHCSAIAGSGERLNLSILKVTSTGKVTVDKIFHLKQIEQFTGDLYFHVRHLSERLKAYNLMPPPKQPERDQRQPG